MKDKGQIGKDATALLSYAAEQQCERGRLIRSAEIMMHYAQQHCHSEGTPHATGCRDYHSLWQFWRLAGLAATPNWHSRDYIDFFASRPSIGSSSVLICGAADYGVLEHLVSAIPKDQIMGTRITVLDLCRTPLEICEWYHREFLRDHSVQIDFSCTQADALNSPFEEDSFDMITNYSFLTRFTDDTRPSLIREWHRILRPGGVVITTVRLASPGRQATVVLDESDFVRSIMHQILEREPWLLPIADSICSLAGAYARSVVSNTLPSIAHLESLFAGFHCTTEMNVFDSDFEGEKHYARVLATKA
jgi:ubiquinone/menaquinone biosynthesis C-methylase UbiE